MLFRISLIILLSTKIYSVPAQQINKSELFKEGIHLDSPNILIPWSFNINDVSKYGNPKIIVLPKKFLSPRFVIIQWDSVKIFNGILVNIYFTKPQYLLKKMNSNIRSFHGSAINSLEKLVSYFQNSGHAWKIVSNKKEIYYSWYFLNTYVRVGRSSSGGIYFIIQNIATES